jgi:hypothetical protein
MREVGGIVGSRVVDGGGASREKKNFGWRDKRDRDRDGGGCEHHHARERERGLFTLLR